MVINYHNITYPDMNNGSGLRVVLWLSGCEHKCKGCQNPQTWDVNSGIPFDEKAKEELFRELDKDYISGLTLTGGDPLHPSNLDGVLDIVTEFNKRYKVTQDVASKADDNHNILNKNGNKIRLSLPKKTIWLYTGYDFDLLQNKFKEYQYTPFASDADKWLTRWEIILQCNILVDGRYIDSQRNITKKWAGSNNQRVIDIKKSLQQGKVILYCE